MPTNRPSIAKLRATTVAAQQIGESVSVWRRAQHLTQAELAQRSHASVRTIAKIESGDATVALATVLSVAHTLGVLSAVVEAFDPMRSDFGATLVSEAIPKRVHPRG